MDKRRVLRLCGMGLCTLGLVVGAQIPYFYWHSKTVGGNLIHQATKALSEGSDAASLQKPNDVITSFPLLPVITGQTSTLQNLDNRSILGLVRISKLNLTAPLLEGTSSNSLNVGVGHLTESAQPGFPGTCVIAAHNATWFRHVDELKPGDSIVLQTKKAEYTYSVTGARVVTAGDKVDNTAKQTIVLEACYPLDALYLTSKRYLVTGVLASVSQTHSGSNLSVPNTVQYVANVPKNVLDEGVTLLENRLPMGSLKYDGKPSMSFTQSNAPLSAVYAILQLYLSYVRASQNKNSADLNQILGEMTDYKKTTEWLNAEISSDPFFNVQANDITYLSKFNISLRVLGDKLTNASAETSIHVPKGNYGIKINFSITGTTFSIYSIDIHKIMM